MQKLGMLSTFDCALKAIGAGSAASLQAGGVSCMCAGTVPALGGCRPCPRQKEEGGCRSCWNSLPRGAQVYVPGLPAFERLSMLPSKAWKTLWV